MVPKTTCKPSKKLSPIIMTVDPPLVHPSLGLMAFIQGVATGSGGYRPTKKKKLRDKNSNEIEHKLC